MKGNGKMKKWLRFFLGFLLSFLMIGCSAVTPQMSVERTIGTVEQQFDSTQASVPDENERSDLKEKESDQTEEESEEERKESSVSEEEIALPEDGIYSSKEEVAEYIFLYGHLPSNFITKKDAEKLGWKGGSLEPFAPGMCIGGSRFGNYEGLLPEKEGRFYTECDIDTLGAEKRGAKRIVFSNDGLIYYTEDHYKSFELLYGEE